ncbi:unnamed protein product [Amoebophrya sp. A25]|nr:unnamed protein product [Amoebophrya sp. A25]|eukprot:GSA25T00013837001.1
MAPSITKSKKILGVRHNDNATYETTVKAYKSLTLSWHPDKKAKEFEAEASAKFKEIAAAYEVLERHHKGSEFRLDNGGDVDSDQWHSDGGLECETNDSRSSLVSDSSEGDSSESERPTAERRKKDASGNASRAPVADRTHRRSHDPFWLFETLWGGKEAVRFVICRASPSANRSNPEQLPPPLDSASEEDVDGNVGSTTGGYGMRPIYHDYSSNFLGGLIGTWETTPSDNNAKQIITVFHPARVDVDEEAGSKTASNRKRARVNSRTVNAQASSSSLSSSSSVMAGGWKCDVSIRSTGTHSRGKARTEIQSQEHTSSNRIVAFPGRPLAHEVWQLISARQTWSAERGTMEMDTMCWYHSTAPENSSMASPGGSRTSTSSSHSAEKYVSED